jgi:phenylpyruvate tautomerase PptA (4-oxalocrotonate tautomerase family)
MPKRKALVTRVSDGKARLVPEDISVVLDEIPDHQILVRTQSVAQNPTDGQQFSEPRL